MRALRHALVWVTGLYVLASGIVWAFEDSIARLYGHAFPVVSEAMLSDPRPSPPPRYAAIWHAEAAKLRDCQYVSIEWFLGPRGGRRTQVVAEFLDPPQVRPQGPLVWDGLRIALDPTNVLENSHADVLHDCGWPWLVRSRFFSGETSQ